MKYKETNPKRHTKHQGKQGTGYRVDLWKDGKPKTFLVCRLVATTFLEDLIATDMTVNHKDGNRLNNSVDNLEWLSIADNIRHGFENNLFSTQKHCILVDKNGMEYKFNSLSKASNFIGRNNGYICSCLKFKRKIIGINNDEYNLILN